MFADELEMAREPAMLSNSLTLNAKGRPDVVAALFLRGDDARESRPWTRRSFRIIATAKR